MGGREEELERLLWLACEVFDGRPDVTMPTDLHVWWRRNHEGMKRTYKVATGYVFVPPSDPQIQGEG